MDYKDIMIDKLDVIKFNAYHDNKYIEFWSPAMYVPYGMQHHEKFGEKYEIKLSFRNEQGQYLKKFADKINAMDSYFKHIHSKTQYIPMIRGGVLSVKLPYTGNTFQCTVKSEFEPLPTVFSIKKGCWVRCLLRIDKVWKYQSRSGCMLIAKQIIILNQVEDAPLVERDSSESD